MKPLVAIHQPNFFPWIGYFDKIRRADIFIFLDSVSYPRSGSGSMGSWVNRVKIAIQGEPRWVTCPIQRMPLGSSINEAEIDNLERWRKKFIATLDTNYRRAVNFQETMDFLNPLIESSEINLANFNISVIQAISLRLNLDTKFVRQSQIKHNGSATELLVSLIKSVEGNGYLAGGGAQGYQNDSIFEENGISLNYQNFQPVSHHPTDGSLIGLSIIDYLMHDGRTLGV